MTKSKEEGRQKSMGAIGGEQDTISRVEPNNDGAPMRHQIWVAPPLPSLELGTRFLGHAQLRAAAQPLWPQRHSGGDGRSAEGRGQG